MSFLEDLNSQQEACVKDVLGKIRCMAGAGTGKTRTLVSRYLYLIKDAGIPVSDILCVTFTNKACQEMRERVNKQIDSSTQTNIMTFHGLCHRILRQDGELICQKGFKLKNSGAVTNLLVQIRNNNNLSSHFKEKDMLEIVKIGKYITLTKEYNIIMTSPDIVEAQKAVANAKTEDEKLFFNYLLEMKKQNCLDYDDLILLALDLLEVSERTSKKWQEKYQFILVDEYQDTSIHQQILLEALCSKNKNVFIVGDINQCIYEWRGANVESMNNFDYDRTYDLSQNYRSGQRILDIANTLIEKNTIRGCSNLTSHNGEDGEVYYYHAQNSIEEASRIIEEIEKLHNAGYKYKDIAVIYRTHDASKKIEAALMRSGIPFSIIRGTKFYEKHEITVAIAYLELILNPNDDIAFDIVINNPPRGIGKKTYQIIKDYQEKSKVKISKFEALKNVYPTFSTKAKENAEYFIKIIEKYSSNYSTFKVSDLLIRLLTDSGYIRYSYGAKGFDIPQDEKAKIIAAYENLDHLIHSIMDYETELKEPLSLEEYLEIISLYTDDKDESADKVQLMTIFSAKGTEYDAVFVPQLNENVLPSSHADSQAKMESERRICYVAFTRAKKYLFLSSSEGFYGNKAESCLPSRFILEAGGEEKIDFLNDWSNDLKRRMEDAFKLPKGTLLKLSGFNIGDRVSHPIFGTGEITDADDKVYHILFDNKKSNTRRVGRQYEELTLAE